MASFAFIIGAMKAGTTSLYDSLVKHEKIYPCLSKEPHFFCENSVDIYNVDCFYDLWPDYVESVDGYFIEASTGYSKFPFEQGVPKKIRAMELDAKFIYIVRNPFERMESHYNFMRRRKYFDKNIDDNHLIQVSNYGAQLRIYLDEGFKIEDFLVVDFCDLKDHPTLVYQRVLQFLCLSADSVEAIDHKNKTDATNKLSLYLINSPFRPLLRFLPSSIKGAIKTLFNKMLPSKEDRVLLTVEQRRYVAGRLQEDMSYFCRVTGYDISKWGFDR
ncbi:sulfotransferase domain-containing protein [Pseudomonadales bacterium]|nr:sulfotransferase domain-containing protein [Pseudomonadales bacterium]